MQDDGYRADRHDSEQSEDSDNANISVNESFLAILLARPMPCSVALRLRHHPVSFYYLMLDKTNDKGESYETN